MSQNTLPDLQSVVVLEYSVSQQSFHQNTIQKLVADNIQSLLRGSHADYVPVGFFLDGYSAYKFSEQLRPMIENAQRTNAVEKPIVDLLTGM